MANKQLCASCGAVLSRYNTTLLCGVCVQAGPQALIPADLWQQPQIRSALKNNDFGEVCAQLRRQTPLTQRQIAEIVGLDQSGLSRLEHAKQRVTHLGVFFRFVEGLGIPLELVLPPGLRNQVKDQSMERRSVLAGAAAAGPVLGVSAAIPIENGDKTTIHIGAAEIQTFRQILSDLSQLDNQIGADRLWRIAQWQLRIAEGAFDDVRFDNRIEGELQNLICDYKRAIGWFLYDSGNHEQARSHFNDALSLAYLNQDHFLIMRIVTNMTRQTIELGRGLQTVHVAQQATKNSGKQVTPHVRSMVAIREAHGWALRGDKTACQAAIGRAHDEFAAGLSDHDPAWVHAYISEAELARQEGACLSALGEYSQAERLFTASTSDDNGGFRRNVGICQIRLSTNSLRMGELEKAASHAHQAADIVRELTSTRVTSELRNLGSQLLPHRSVPEVHSALEFLDACVS